MITVHAAMFPNEAAVQEFLHGPGIVTILEFVGFTLNALVQAKTGIDTGRLVASEDYKVRMLAGIPMLHMGSNVGLGDYAVPYWLFHMAPGKPDGTRADWRGTHPYASALEELGIPYVSNYDYRV